MQTKWPGGVTPLQPANDRLRTGAVPALWDPRYFSGFRMR